MREDEGAEIDCTTLVKSRQKIGHVAAQHLVSEAEMHRNLDK